jgi:hypothetical protein
MGLLDDAIREHLELKRSRGADSAEMERLEREALGAGEPPAAAAEPAAAEAQAAPQEHAIATQEAHPPPPAQEHSQPEPEPEPERPEPAKPQSEHIEQPTRQFTLEELEEAERREDEAGEEHDELEETPDFLQETPEHDRLWFEQKPPKDFDF